jgi:hypothetical protein
LRILGFLPGVGRTQAEVLRAARVLGFDYDATHSERQVVRLAEQCSSLGTPATVVTTDREIAVVRELLARTPKTPVILLSSACFQKLPHFLAVCPSIKCFLLSRTLTSSAEYFIQVLEQISAGQPLPISLLLGNHARTDRFFLNTREDKASALKWASEFFNWALGDPSDPGVQERVRQFCDTLDELVTNALRHTQTQPQSRPSFPVTIELGFDGMHLAQRVVDLAGNLERNRIVNTLAKDHRHNEEVTPNDTPSGGMGLKMVAGRQHRLIFHLDHGINTTVTCITRVSHRFKDQTLIPASIEFYEWKGRERT